MARVGTDDTAKHFGARLRWWRQRRGLSQLELAGAAGTTQRHLSFLESGRAAPSREMILRLAAALDIPLRQQNALLLAAGYAPAWRESRLAAPELAVHFRRDATSLRLFTTIATLGTPQDVTVQEIRVECFFPADEGTGRVFHDWAAGPSA